MRETHSVANSERTIYALAPLPKGQWLHLGDVAAAIAIAAQPASPKKLDETEEPCR